MTYKEFIDNILNTRGRFGCGNEYYERHHILPKCMGGTDEEDNLIDLFASEHYEAHKILALENPEEDGLARAWFLMSHMKNQYEQRVEVSKEEYEEARKRFAEVMSKNMAGEKNPMFGRTGELNPMFGVSPSKQTREKLSKSLYGRFRGEDSPHYGTHLSEESKEKISKKAKERLKDKTRHPMYGTHRSGKDNPFYGHKHSEETKKKISEAQKGKYSGENSPNYGKKFSEEHKRHLSESKKGVSVGGNKVMCDGMIFNSQNECADYLNISASTLSQYLSGKKKWSKKFKNRDIKKIKDGE